MKKGKDWLLPHSAGGSSLSGPELLEFQPDLILDQTQHFTQPEIKPK